MHRSFLQLDQLISVISSSVEKLKAEYDRLGEDLPSLEDQQSHPFDTINASDRLREAVLSIQGACAQLSTLVTPPQRTVTAMSLDFMTSACLGTVAQAKVADHLQEFPDGLHVSKLSEVTGIECNYLARILRLLATKHIFMEVSPDHFANNRLSIQLVSSNPLSAFSGFCADEILRSSTELHNTIVKSRPDKKRTAWSRATGHLDPVWEYYEKQDAVRAQRFGKAMIGFSSFITFDSTLYGFPWKDLAPKSTVCDLGSGLGHVSMHIARACPQINIVLQDLPNTIEQAKLIWRERAPEIIDTGRVEFVPVNFLRQSPVTACDYYFMKNVIHNWSDANADIIFMNVRKVMKGTSRLLIQEFVMQHVAEYPQFEGDQSIESTKAPKPLLPNFGVGNMIPYYLDIAMMARTALSCLLLNTNSSL